MKNVRIILWSLVVIMAVGLAYLTFDWYRSQLAETKRPVFGGEFSLTKSSGGTIASRPVFGAEFHLDKSSGGTINKTDLMGKPHALFFGYTHCPDVCPTTLYEASGWLKKLGTDADKLSFYFVTVDPQRDTQEILSEYISAFDQRIVGITGDPEKVAAMLKSYKVYFKKIPDEDGEYSMDHTASVYLLDANSGFVGTIAYGEDTETAIAKLRRLVR